MHNMHNMQNTKPELPNQTYQAKPTTPNLPNKPTKQTYQTKPTKYTKLNLANRNYQTKPTKPNLLVKAGNTWVRSALGNVFLHRHCLWCLWQIWGMFEHWDCFDNLGNNLKYCFRKVNSILKMEIFVSLNIQSCFLVTFSITVPSTVIFIYWKMELIENKSI